MDKDLALINEKVDQLALQIGYLTEQADAQQRRVREFDELKADLIPIGNQLIHLTINELEEIGSDFELEDLLYLLKRVLRNTHLILSMMDRFESLMGIADEVELLGKQVFSSAVEALDQLEQSGLFTQAGDLFNTLAKENTLSDLNKMLKAFHQEGKEEASAPSLVSLVREANRPESRRAFSRLVKVLQALGDDTQDNHSQVD
jgi:histidyl-tRNA synthetase